MKITVGKTAGFCFGVQRAVETAFKNADKNICTLGPIIHNKIVTDELKTKGVEIINEIEEANGRTILIRAHGIPKQIYSQMEALGINYIDCTCPFVKKIHRLVQKNFTAGKKIIIIGNPEHPEIIGINGFADNQSIIIQELSDAHTFQNNKAENYFVVAQTTFSHELFNKIIELLAADNVEICNTICNTTYDRQEEAKRLSKISDKMIVIGDKSSSNSTKLLDICRENCCNTFFIQNTTDLLLNTFNPGDRIGIMAGASTPLTVIEEAVFFMNQLLESEKTFEQLLNESFTTLRVGEIVKGTVIFVSANEIILDIRYKSDGVISKDNFTDAHVSLTDLVSVGDEVEAIVLKIDDGEGNVTLSKKKLDLQRGFKILEKAFNENLTVSGKIIEAVRSGLIAMVSNVRLFIPASCISNSRVTNLNPYIGKTMDFKIIEFNRLKHRYVGSCKELLPEKAPSNNSSLGSLQIGQEFEGTVTKIADFGLFVNIGEFSGLVHSSEIGWQKNIDVKDKFNVDDKVKVFVKQVDEEKNRLSLSMKNPADNPWNTVSEKYPEGKIVVGKVARINNYGAFIELEPMIDGLLHISQISNEHVEKVSDKLKVGEMINLRVLSTDPEKKRVSLSMLDIENDDNKKAD